MSVDPAIFRALVAQGASPEMLLAVVEAAAAVDDERREKRRANNAERQARYRAKSNGSNARNALHGVTERDSQSAPPNDIYSNPPENPDGAKAPCPPLAEKVVSAWNEGPAKAGATKAQALDASRRKALAVRVREHGETAVFSAIANLARSEFHCGKNERNWRANIGWLLKSPENFMKALEFAPVALNGKPAQPWNDERRAEAELRRQRLEERMGRKTEPIPIGNLVSAAPH